MKFFIFALAACCLLAACQSLESMAQLGNDFQMLLSNSNISSALDQHLAIWGGGSGSRFGPWRRKDSKTAVLYGSANFSCGNASDFVSNSTPASVHALKPGDIKVVAAMGDSITAGNGAKASNLMGILFDYRGVSFSIGGDEDLENITTVPNVLRELGSNATGASVGAGPVWMVSSSRLNVASDAATTSSMASQAQQLVQRISSQSSIDMQNDWKLVTIFVGLNDLCSSCKSSSSSSRFSFPWARQKKNNDPSEWLDNLKSGIKVLHDNLPRTLVSVVSVPQVELLKQTQKSSFMCNLMQSFTCSCLSSSSSGSDGSSSRWSGFGGRFGPSTYGGYGGPSGYGDGGYNGRFGPPRKSGDATSIDDLATLFQNLTASLQEDGIFDDKEDFTVVVQPFLENAQMAYATGPQMVDLSYFAPDCFHWSQKGHAAAAVALWNNMLEAVGNKTNSFNFSQDQELQCPDSACPFIRTTKNSANCSVYMAELESNDTEWWWQSTEGPLPSNETTAEVINLTTEIVNVTTTEPREFILTPQPSGGLVPIGNKSAPGVLQNQALMAMQSNASSGSSALYITVGCIAGVLAIMIVASLVYQARKRKRHARLDTSSRDDNGGGVNNARADGAGEDTPLLKEDEDAVKIY